MMYFKMCGKEVTDDGGWWCRGCKSSIKTTKESKISERNKNKYKRVSRYAATEQLFLDFYKRLYVPNRY